MKSCRYTVDCPGGRSQSALYICFGGTKTPAWSSQTPTKARGFVRNGFMVFFHGIQSYGRLEINGFLPGC